MRGEDFQILGRTRGHLRRARAIGKRFSGGGGGGGWSTYGTRDQTYLEEKIRLEGAAKNVAEERIPAPIRPSFKRKLSSLRDTCFGYQKIVTDDKSICHCFRK